MPGGGRPAATRSNQVRLRRQLTQVQKGAALLRRKRESLVTELFRRARVAIDTRKDLDAQARTAYRSLLEALSARDEGELLALGWPTRELKVELEPLEVWGLHAVDLARVPTVVRGLAARAVAPGPGDAPSLAAAVDFERLIEFVLEAAPKEYLMRRLGHELARASRLVNTLEQRVATGLTRELAGIRRTLEEREREEHLRLKHLMARRKGR